MKATTLMQKSQNVSERAESFSTSIKRNLQKSVLDAISDNIEKIDDSIFGLLDFSLDTDVNRGQVQVTRDNAESRFSQVIELEYEKELLERELKIKQASFDKYFGDETN